MAGSAFGSGLVSGFGVVAGAMNAGRASDRADDANVRTQETHDVEMKANEKIQANNEAMADNIIEWRASKENQATQQPAGASGAPAQDNGAGLTPPPLLLVVEIHEQVTTPLLPLPMTVLACSKDNNKNKYL